MGAYLNGILITTPVLNGITYNAYLNGVAVFSDKIKQEALFESSTPGSYDIEIIKPGIYNVICIAGGGGGQKYKLGTAASGRRFGSGGSGSGFNVNFYLEPGIYHIIVGVGGEADPTSAGVAGDGGNSSFMNNISYGGHGGNVVTPAAGGATPTIVDETKEVIFIKAGNPGVSGKFDAGGTSVYGTFGKGGAADTPPLPGNNGYVKVTLINVEGNLDLGYIEDNPILGIDCKEVTQKSSDKISCGNIIEKETNDTAVDTNN